MLVVVPDGSFPDDRLKDPIPYVEKNYRVPANRESRRTGVGAGG
jgi:hypothetical protein